LFQFLDRFLNLCFGFWLPPKIDQLSLDNQIDAMLGQDSIWSDYNSLHQQLREMDNSTNSIRFDRDEVKKRLKNQIQKIRTKKIHAEVYQKEMFQLKHIDVVHFICIMSQLAFTFRR
jgi:hypothetical protein